MEAPISCRDASDQVTACDLLLSSLLEHHKICTTTLYELQNELRGFLCLIYLVSRSISAARTGFGSSNLIVKKLNTGCRRQSQSGGRQATPKTRAQSERSHATWRRLPRQAASWATEGKLLPLAPRGKCSTAHRTSYVCIYLVEFKHSNNFNSEICIYIKK